MNRRRSLVLVPIVALVLIVVPSSQAADQLTVPTTIGQTVQVTWQGSVLPGANPTSDCSGTAISTDTHDVSIVVPTGAYTTVSVQASATVTFTGQADMIVTVVAPNGQATVPPDAMAV